MVCGTNSRGQMRVRELHPGLYCFATILAKAFRRSWSADYWRRHQVAGRRYDYAPRPDESLQGTRCAPGSHLSTEFRWQHRFYEYAGARAVGIKEDFQNAGRYEPMGPGTAAEAGSCWAERLRALAGRSQMVLHPHGRNDLWKCALELRTKARGLGFAEFRWSGH